MPAGTAAADCDIAAGCVAILSNDFEALRMVNDKAVECASDTVTVTANATTEHTSLQVPALSVSPAEYTVKTLAKDSIVPLLNAGLLRPLDDLVAQYGQDLSPQQLIRIDGHVMAIAFMANARHLAYRRDNLEKIGITESPRSYEDILRAAETIRAAGIIQTPLGANDKIGWDLGGELVNMYLRTGGDFFSPGSATLALDHDKAVAALDMMKSLTAYMAPNSLTYDFNALAPPYQQGQVAIVKMWGSRTGSFLGSDALPEVAANTVLANAPTVAGGTIPATTIWWDGFGIAKNISDEDAEASSRAMLHGIQASTATDNPDLAAWLIPGYQPTPAVVGVIDTAMAGAKP